MKINLFKNTFNLFRCKYCLLITFTYICIRGSNEAPF